MSLGYRSSPLPFRKSDFMVYLFEISDTIVMTYEKQSVSPSRLTGLLSQQTACLLSYCDSGPSLALDRVQQNAHSHLLKLSSSCELALGNRSICGKRPGRLKL
jgi:hypothetical protein